MVEGTALVVLRPDGWRVEGAALVGTLVEGGDPERGGRAAFRIDGLGPDPDDPEVTLYDLSTRDPADGTWKPYYCTPDARGVTGAMFVAGSWDARGTHLHDDRFSVSCTSAAIGKCGGRLQAVEDDGRRRSGWDYRQACTRLFRADYYGDGVPHTRNGVRIEIVDRLGGAEAPVTGAAFEAAWTPGGAACVAWPRLTTWSLDAIARECPERLAGRVGEGCGPADLESPGVLLFNRSPPDAR